MVKFILRDKEFAVKSGMSLLSALEKNDILPDSGLHACPHCGQLTSAPGLCAFCRMIEKAAAPIQSVL